jgi:pheromone shutdown protein TraB
MVAEDEVGKRIVEDTAKAGSKNYQLLLRLLDRGAVLVKTEDFSLVKKEYDRLRAITQAASITQKLVAFAKYKLIKTVLLKKRDVFIAERIDRTLKAGEKAILFIGAFHNVKGRLSKIVHVREIKDADKVKRYQKLLPFYRRNERQFEELGAYLVSEITDVCDS